MENQTIVIADDSQTDLMLLKVAIKKANLRHPVHSVSNGEEAIDYFRGKAPYSDRAQFPMPVMLLLDLKMPRKDGFDVLAWLRKQPNLRRLPVFILTASMRRDDIARAYELGANGFLVKPGPIEELVATVQFLRDWLTWNRLPPIEE